MFTFRFIALFLICLATGSSASAAYSCKDILAVTNIFHRAIYMPHAENALDGREYRQAALQIFDRSLYEATIIHNPFAEPFVFIKHSYANYNFLDRAMGLFKKQEFPLNQWVTEARDVPGATTIAEIPDLPGQFVVGKMDGTLQLVSMNYQYPRIAKTVQNDLIVWDESSPHSIVGTQLEKLSEFIFSERERRSAELFAMSILGELHNPATTVRRNNFEIVKNPKAIISLFVTRDGFVWYRNMSSEIHHVDLIDLLNPETNN